MTKVIRIKESTYRKLANDGKWSETMDDILVRLLKDRRSTVEEVDR